MVSAGLLATGAVTTSALTLTALCVPFVTPALRKICIPYVPATPQQLKNVAEVLSVCSTEISPLVDLGSGDGRVVSSFFYFLNPQKNVIFCDCSNKNST